VQARGLGLVGFVQNRRDGAVEGEAEGPADRVAEFAQWLRSGPLWANVEHLEVEDRPVSGYEADFEVRR